MTKAMASRKTYDAIYRNTCSDILWHHLMPLICQKKLKEIAPEKVKIRSRDSRIELQLQRDIQRAENKNPINVQGPSQFQLGSHFHVSSRSIPLERFLARSTCPAPAQHFFSLPSLDHHPYSISLYLGPEAPLAKHQASAPSLPMSLLVKTMFVMVLLTFNASARACDQSNGKPEDLRCNLQKHMQRYIVAPFNAIDMSEEAQRNCPREGQDKVKRQSN